MGVLFGKMPGGGDIISFLKFDKNVIFAYVFDKLMVHEYMTAVSSALRDTTYSRQKYCDYCSYTNWLSDQHQEYFVYVI